MNDISRAVENSNVDKYILTAIYVLVLYQIALVKICSKPKPMVQKNTQGNALLQANALLLMGLKIKN